MRFFVQASDECPCPWQSRIEVIDAKEQEEAVAWRRGLWTCQRGMLVRAPCVQTQQHRSVRIDDLPEIVVGGSRLRQAK